MPGNTHRLIWYRQLARLDLINHWKLFGDEQCKMPIPNMKAKWDERLPRADSAGRFRLQKYGSLRIWPDHAVALSSTYHNKALALLIMGSSLGQLVAWIQPPRSLPASQIQYSTGNERHARPTHYY